MKQSELIEQFYIFLCSIITTVYAVFSKNKKEAMERSLLLAKLLGSVMVAFFIMPAVAEFYNLTLKMTLLITVVFAYALESILKTAVKRVLEIINGNNNGDSISND